MTILYCTDFWHCSELGITGLISTLTAALYIHAIIKFRNLEKGANPEILSISYSERLIFLICFGQILLSIVYYVFWFQVAILYLIRTLRMIQDITIFINFLALVLSNTQTKMIKNVYIALLLYSLVVFVISAASIQGQAYECQHYGWLLLSVSTLIFTVCSFVLAIILMNRLSVARVKMQNSLTSEIRERYGFFNSKYINSGDLFGGQRDERSNERKFFLLLFFNLLSAVSMIIWDILLSVQIEKLGDCKLFGSHVPHIEAIFSICFRTGCTYLPIWTVYYILFWSDRHQFDELKENWDISLEFGEDNADPYLTNES